VKLSVSTIAPADEKGLISRYMVVSKTPKRGGVVISIPSNISNLMQILVGDPNQISNSPTTVFNADRVAFLAELSRKLLAHKVARALPDVVSFAYWSRRANLMRLADKFAGDEALRMGLGLSFHICPANVPINFAFSMAFGLLSGNTCVLRLPSKSTPTLEVMVEVIGSLLMERDYATLAHELMLVRYDRNDEISRFWMSVADGRIVWGGDTTVDYMRSMPCRPRSREIAFPDRYSIAAIDPSAVLDLDNAEMQALCLRLFNDMYLMDQAACSSPQLLVWVGDRAEAEEAKARFWPEIEHLAKSRYMPQAVQIMDKYVQACRNAVNNDQVISIKRDSNQLYRIQLSGVSERQDECRGYYGTIHEVTFDTIEPLAPMITEKYQTLTYFGMDITQVREFITKNRLRGIDRVVPIGKALDMDIVWDGYEIVSALSRYVVLDFS